MRRGYVEFLQGNFSPSKVGASKLFSCKSLHIKYFGLFRPYQISLQLQKSVIIALKSSQRPHIKKMSVAVLKTKTKLYLRK